MKQQDPTAARELLMQWRRQGTRTMPWRSEPRDPYAVWISEVMLQQTRVATVGPYFEAFLNKFPNVQTLAASPLEDVLGAWSGLGYYRRARALHEAAKVVASQHDGHLPQTIQELRTLPGIGAYTSAAIASIAFGVPVAAIDGNVIRVISRLFAIDAPIDDAAWRKRVESEADRLMDRTDPGTFNEAMMDLGAVLCTPKSPSCPLCPVRTCCVAHSLGKQEQLPRVRSKTPSPRVTMAAYVVSAGDRILHGRRHEQGLFGGLWEPMMVEIACSGTARKAIEQATNATRWTRCDDVAHVLTHRVLQVEVRTASAAEALAIRPGLLAGTYGDYAWWTADDTAKKGTSSLARKVVNVAGRRRKA